MINFIIQYWVQALFGLVLTLLGVVWRYVCKRFEQNRIQEKAIKDGVIALLHDRLYQSTSHYIQKGYIPIDDAERVLDNLRYIYEAYKALGGNGTGTNMYNRAISLPIKKEETNE